MPTVQETSFGTSCLPKLWNISRSPGLLSEIKEKVISKEAGTYSRLFFTQECTVMTTQVAFLFPGQGSQAVGMGADVFEASPAARRVFESADEALGISLSTICFQGPDDVLRETINTQPAIVTVSLALLAALQEALTEHTSSWSSPLIPSYTAGHSVREYAALVTSGALLLKDAVRLVRERGRLMHQEGTVCPGGMAAVIGLDAEILQEVCHDATIPIIGNIHATPLIEAQAIREELTQQIAAPVQWVRTIEYLAEAGVTIFLEIGPGQALTGMVKRIAKGVTTLNVSSATDIDKVVGTIREMGLVVEV